MKHILPTETINKVLNYLCTKPFSEVSHLIDEVKQKAIEYLEKKEDVSDAPDKQ